MKKVEIIILAEEANLMKILSSIMIQTIKEEITITIINNNNLVTEDISLITEFSKYLDIEIKESLDLNGNKIPYIMFLGKENYLVNDKVIESLVHVLDKDKKCIKAYKEISSNNMKSIIEDNYEILYRRKDYKRKEN